MLKIEDLLMFPRWQEAAWDLLVLAAEVGCYTGASLSALIAWRLAKVTPVSDVRPCDVSKQLR